MRSILRSDMAARSATAIARRSSAWLTIWAWKLPPLTIASASGKTSGLSVALLASTSNTPLTYVSACRAAPWTCGTQRNAYASCTRGSPSRCDSRISEPPSRRR